MPDPGTARHLPAHEYRRERWANGVGWTRRILRLAADGPDWRDGGDGGWDLSLSIADIEGPAAYSPLPGVQREQVLLSGDGLQLRFDDGGTAELAPPHGRFNFPGGRAVTGVPAEGPPVRAFNLMWRPQALEAKLLHRPLVGGMFCFCDVATAWAVHLVAGSARVAWDGGRFELAHGDSAWLAAGARQRFVLDGAGEALLVQVTRPAQ